MAFDPVEFAEQVLRAREFRAALTRDMECALRNIVAPELKALAGALTDAQILSIFEAAEALRFEVSAVSDAEDAPDAERWTWDELRHELYKRIFKLDLSLGSFKTGGEVLAFILEWIRLTPEQPPSASSDF